MKDMETGMMLFCQIEGVKKWNSPSEILERISLNETARGVQSLWGLDEIEGSLGGPASGMDTD